MLAVVLGTVGILCIPVGLFVALRLFASFPKPGPMRAAITVPQHATLTRVQPTTIGRPVRALTASRDGVYR